MKKTRLTDEQMRKIVSEAYMVPVEEVASKHGVSAQFILNWRQHFLAIKSYDVNNIERLELENARLRKLILERDCELEVVRRRRHGSVRAQVVKRIPIEAA